MKVGAADEGTDQGECGCPYLGIDLPIGDPVGRGVYGLEICIKTPRIGRFLGGFRHSVDHKLMGRRP